MRKVRDVLRIHFESQVNPRRIALICGVGKRTEQRYLERQRGGFELAFAGGSGRHCPGAAAVSAAGSIAERASATGPLGDSQGTEEPQQGRHPHANDQGGIGSRIEGRLHLEVANHLGDCCAERALG